MNIIGRNAILYFFTQRSCSHCAMQRPLVNDFRSQNIGKLFVYELDAERHPGVEGWEPRSTPAFALKVNGILMATHEGTLSLVQLEKFVERGASGKYEDEPKRRRKRSKPKAEPEHEAEEIEESNDEESDEDAA